MLSFPVGYQCDEGHHMVYDTDETKKFLDIPVVVSAESKTEAIKNYWTIVSVHLSFLNDIYQRHNRWALFYKGSWKERGTHWFSVFGFHFYFRHGKNMRGGAYLPFTKLNVSLTNYWRIPKKIKKSEESFGSGAH